MNSQFKPLKEGEPKCSRKMIEEIDVILKDVLDKLDHFEYNLNEITDKMDETEVKLQKIKLLLESPSGYDLVH